MMNDENLKYQLMADPNCKPGYPIIICAPKDWRVIKTELENVVDLWESVKDEGGFPMGLIKKMGKLGPA